MSEFSSLDVGIADGHHELSGYPGTDSWEARLAVGRTARFLFDMGIQIHKLMFAAFWPPSTSTAVDSPLYTSDSVFWP